MGYLNPHEYHYCAPRFKKVHFLSHIPEGKSQPKPTFLNMTFMPWAKQAKIRPNIENFDFEVGKKIFFDQKQFFF